MMERQLAKLLLFVLLSLHHPITTVGIVQSINFAAYDSVRRILHKRDHPSSSPNDYLKHDSLRNCGVAGFIAGSGLAFITSPLIMIKCQQQITGNSYKEAVRNALYGCNHKISIKRCFVGFLPHYGSEAFGRAIYYTVYEAMKRSIAMQKEEQRIGGQGSVTLHERMMSAGLAGIVCWAFIFPMDTLRSRMYSQKHSSNSRILSTMEMARKICKEGVVYRGFWVSVLRAGPVAAAVLPVYDIILEKLSSS
jgi:solute carrier family 25 carnitine/acylcarnitine transporter 20/29